MRFRFAGCLGLADLVTAANAALGFVAVAVVVAVPDAATLAARLVLLAAIADGLDGVVARVRGSTPAGEYLDSLADVASFAVAPAVLVVAVGVDSAAGVETWTAAALAVGALFVAAGVVRLALYTAYDVGNDHTEGVQTTLAATILAAAVLAGVDYRILVGATAVFALLMTAPVTYPDLRHRDAFLMGGVQALAVLAPTVATGLFPKLLLAAALAYLLFAPRFYWRT